MFTSENGARANGHPGPDRHRLTERDADVIGRDLLESDPERGVALVDLDRQALYSNAAARNMLRDGSARGSDALLPASVDQWIAKFVERMKTARTPITSEAYYPSASERKLRLTLASHQIGSQPMVILRTHHATPWPEPTVRRLQARFGLTLREAQVAAGVARGHTNAEVADKLGIVEKTVKNVLMSVFTKCGVRNRVELALRAHEAPVGNLQPKV